MASINDKLEKEIRKFMDKQKSIENSIQNDLNKVLDEIQAYINQTFKSTGEVNFSNLDFIMAGTIKPFIDSKRQEMEQIMDNAIQNQYEVGIDNAERMLHLSGTQTVTDKNSIKDEAALAALLLFGRRLVNGLLDDLTSNISKDLMSVYIDSKNTSNINNNTSTINTILSGSIISKYINSTFQKYMNRADTIAQTETVRALNHGHLASYVDNEHTNLVKWIEIKDGKLCRFCKEKASGGKESNGVYDINSVQAPPLHPNCRCILVPYNSSW